MSASASSAPSVATSSPAPVIGPGGLLRNPVTRLEKTTACLPIVYGSVAFYLGKKAGEYQTHQWTLYLRGPNGDEDLSPVIAKVVFQLHASFAQPTRELTEPP
jgi:YEATS domain-containing protein 4